MPFPARGGNRCMAGRNNTHMEESVNKWIGGLLQFAGAILFVAAGAEEEILLFPAAASQLAGIALWSRSRKPDRALPRPETEALDARLARIEEVLTGVQADTVRLREGRDFMDELYAGKPGQSRELTGRED